MPSFVAGWEDDANVYLVERNGESVIFRRSRANWSAFVRGLDDDDRRAIQRSSDVIALKVQGDYVRIDFRNRWARRDYAETLRKAIQAKRVEYVFGEQSDELDAGIFESDVGPLRRMLSDIPQITIGDPRIGYFDLETDSRCSFADIVEGKGRILSWALVGADEWFDTGLLEEDTDAAERALIEAFFVAASRFDLLLAWNGNDFDFPVLKNRSNEIEVRPNGKHLVWERWCWLDQMLVFKKYNQAHESGEERTSFKLDAVAQHLLGEGKHDFDALKTWEAWHAGYEQSDRLLRYNLQDTRLLPRIEDKTGFVALHLAVCQVTRCFPNTNSLGAAMQGDGFLLALGASNNFRFPNKPYFEEDQMPEAFAGAFVMEPTRVGLFEDVHVCDFAGLYPSIMRSWNMSPDTLVHGMRSSAVPVCKLPDRDVKFRTDKRGMFPLALDQIVAQRAEYTKRADAAEPGSDEWHRYKRLSSAFKIIANSFYGIVGSPFTRFFDRTIAEGVTQTGAYLIKHVVEVSQRSGLKPFYGDTDSVFASGDGAAFEKMVETLNESWSSKLSSLGCTESRIKLEFEKSFSRLVLVSKKRYAATYSRYKGKPAPANMKPEIKGLEFKRGDTLKLARRMQGDLIDQLLAGVLDAQGAREFVARWRQRVKAEPLDLSDVVLSNSIKGMNEYAKKFTSRTCTNKVMKKSCGYDFGFVDFPRSFNIEKNGIPACPRCGVPRSVLQPPVHVRVAQMLKDRGEAVTERTRIEYLFIGGESGEPVAVPAHDPGMLERIDRDYYWDKRIYPPTQRILECVFPSESWKDTATIRKRAAAAEKKRYLSDLPLFSSVEKPVRLPIGGRIRKVQPIVQDAAGPEVRVKLNADTISEETLIALQKTFLAYPGSSPVRVEMKTKDSNVVFAAGMRIARSKELRLALSRVIKLDQIEGLEA
jgi:DNA polymerase elongation subunit (family B)